MLLDRFCADQSTVTFDSTAAIDSTVTSCPFNGQVNASKYINANRVPGVEHPGVSNLGRFGRVEKYSWTLWPTWDHFGRPGNP